MDNKVVIREEKISDRTEIREVVREAFLHVPMSDHDEHELVERLRKSDAYIPELAMVAETRGNIIGFVMLTEAIIEGEAHSTPVLLLAPLAVHPVYQGMGIGTALMEAANLRADGLNYAAIVLLGHPDYYSRFGYRLTSEYGIRFRGELSEEYCLILPLKTPLPTGEVVWSKAFDE